MAYRMSIGHGEKSCAPFFLIQVDGNVSFENAPVMQRYGADMFVEGSSSIFHQTSASAICIP